MCAGGEWGCVGVGGWGAGGIEWEAAMQVEWDDSRGQGQGHEPMESTHAGGRTCSTALGQRAMTACSVCRGG